MTLTLPNAKTIFLDCEHHRRHLYICSRFVFVNSIFRRCLVYYNSRNVKQYSCTEFLLEDDFENCYEYNVYYLLSVNLVPPSLSFSLSLFFFDFLLTSRGESYSFFSKKERRELSPSTSLCRRTKVPESQRTKSVSRSLWDAEERFAGMGSKKADHYPLVLHWSRYPMQPRLQRLSSLLYYNRDSVRCWTLGASAVLKPIRV